MSKVWDKVVEDLQKYSETKTEKTFLQRMWNIVFTKSNCNQECSQGRNCKCQ